MQRVEGARKFSLRKQSTFGDTTTGFPAKWRLRNERRNSLLMMHYYPYLGRASDWLNQIFFAARPIRSTNEIWVVTHHQYQMEFLRLFLRHHLVGKRSKVGCFLRLLKDYFYPAWSCISWSFSELLLFFTSSIWTVYLEIIKAITIIIYSKLLIIFLCLVLYNF